MKKDSKRALLLIDFINDIIHPTGKIAAKGYTDFCQRRSVSHRVSSVISQFRNNSELILHVRVGFTGDYTGLPIESPILGRARDFGVLKLGSWGTEFVEWAAPTATEHVTEKCRVSAFCGTNLDLVLRARDVKEVLIAGVATDLAVESAARDAHDRDYGVVVLEDCCAAANDTDHESALKTISKFGKVVNSTKQT